MMVNIDLPTVGLVVIFFLGFVLLGAIAERKAHFYWPFDFYSVMIYTLGVVVMAIMLWKEISIPWVLIAISLMAYLVGYVASSRRKHVNIFKPNFQTRKIEVPYVVPYRKGKQWFLQRQSLKEHAKKVLFHITTELSTNWDLNRQWAIEFEDPLFPTINMRIIIAEIYNPDKFEWVKKGPLKMKRYTPEIYTSPEGMANALELIMIADAHEKDVRTVIKLTTEFMSEKHENETKNNERITNLLIRLFGSRPYDQIDRAIKENEAEAQKAAEQKQIPEQLKNVWFHRRRADVR